MSFVPPGLRRRARTSRPALTAALIAGLAVAGQGAVGIASDPTSPMASRTVAVEYYPNGNIMSQTEQLVTPDGQTLLDGTTTSWYENGQPALRQSFENNVPVGNYESWYENGQPELLYAFENGKPNGAFTHWHDTGEIESQGFLRDGEYDGEWIAQHADGAVATVGEFEAGHEVGEWLYISSEGDVTSASYDTP